MFACFEVPTDCKYCNISKDSYYTKQAIHLETREALVDPFLACVRYLNPNESGKSKTWLLIMWSDQNLRHFREDHPRVSLDTRLSGRDSDCRRVIGFSWTKGLCDTLQGWLLNGDKLTGSRAVHALCVVNCRHLQCDLSIRFSLMPTNLRCSKKYESFKLKSGEERNSWEFEINNIEAK